MFPEKKSDYIFCFLLCIPAVFFLFNPAKFPADDGFFYPQIAYNFVHGKGSYFNDLYLTNGYHPLWMLFCVIAELINPFAKQDVVYILWIFQVIFIILTFKKLEFFFENNLSGKIIAYFTISFLFFSLGTLYLTEAHLNLLCFSLMLAFLASGKKNDWIFGFLFSLIFLSRLDNVFPLIFISLYYFFQRKWDFRVFVKSGLIILLLCGSYLLSNWHWFGNFVPISGRIKSSFPNVQFHIPLKTVSIFFLIITLIYIVLAGFCKQLSNRILKLFFSAGAMTQLLYNFAFQSQIGQWYFVVQMLVLVLLIADLSNLLLKRTKPVLLYILLSLGLIITSFAGYLKMSSNFSLLAQNKIMDKKNDEIKIFAEKLKAELPKHSRVFTYDFPGKLAFYSDLEIIPADGLVANQEYFDAISNSDFSDFLRKNKIDYIILPSCFSNTNPYIVGMNIVFRDQKPVYFVTNSLYKTSNLLKMSNFYFKKSYPNPVKTWQKDYDSVSVFKIKSLSAKGKSE